jgi:uncharacterized protein YjbI with pentapeptide repeats
MANLSEANLAAAHLEKANLHKANLAGANIAGGVDLGGYATLTEANLSLANLKGADLNQAWARKANFYRAELGGANLSKANLPWADLTEARLRGANLRGADLGQARLMLTDLRGADLSSAQLSYAILVGAKLGDANLNGAVLHCATLARANLSGGNLSGANLQGATLVETDLTGADLTGCRIYGVSAWGLKLAGAKQQNLVITQRDEPQITVDNIEVAQFVYLLLHNEKIRNVIDTIGKKGVLLLGRFTEGRMVVLERVRDKLRDLGFVPMVFNFDKPETKDFTGTVRLLCGLSKFVIVDITNPRSAPLELQATVPDYMVPFAPILQKGDEENPFAMLVDLKNKHDWVLQPVIRYPTVDRLIEVLEDKIIRAAEAKFNELLARRTEQLRVENV